MLAVLQTPVFIAVQTVSKYPDPKLIKRTSIQLNVRKDTNVNLTSIKCNRT